MKYQVEENRIYTEDENGKVLAEITFVKKNDRTYDIDHTFVDDTLRGQGIASVLVEKAVKEIRSRGFEVSATCSYAKKWMEKHLES